MQHARGFTVIELLIVIAIIGVLVTIATLNFGLVRDNARDRVAIADLEQVQLALSVYQESAGGYVNTNGAVQELRADDGSTSPIEAALFPAYLDELPANTTIYYDSDGVTYCIGVALRRDVNQPDFHYSDCLSDGADVTLSAGDLNAPDDDHTTTLGNYVP